VPCLYVVVGDVKGWLGRREPEPAMAGAALGAGSDSRSC